MHKIAICDTNKDDREFLFRDIQNFDPAASITIFKKGDSLLKEISTKGCPYHIIFIEVDLGSKDGIAIAQKIHHINVTTQIIFITNNTESISRSYCVPHTFYLLKSQIGEYLPLALTHAYENIHNNNSDLLTVSFNGTVHILHQQDILYLERSKRITLIITSSGTYKTSASFVELANQLNETFIICHRSYMVNLSFIKSFSRTQLQLCDGTFISIGRTHYQQVRTAFRNFLNPTLPSSSPTYYDADDEVTE